MPHGVGGTQWVCGLVPSALRRNRKWENERAEDARPKRGDRGAERCGDRVRRESRSVKLRARRGKCEGRATKVPGAVGGDGRRR